MSTEASAMRMAVHAFNDCQRRDAFPAPSQMAKVRWWNNEVTAYGQRVAEHQARIDSQIADIDAMLADYRRIGA